MNNQNKPYKCTLFYEGDFTPSEKRELRAVRMERQLDDCGQAIDRAADKIWLFRAEDFVVTGEPGDLWITDILAYNAKGTSETISQLKSTSPDGIRAAFLGPKSLTGGFLFDTCAPGDLAIVVENRGDKAIRFTAEVAGKCILK